MWFGHWPAAILTAQICTQMMTALSTTNTPPYRTDYNLEAFLATEDRTRRHNDSCIAQIALNVNVLANVLLQVVKVIAVTSIRSLSLAASLTDSALGFLCTMIIWTTSHLANHKLKSMRMSLPVGRRRLESLGVLVFSILMTVSFLQILQESAKRHLQSGALGTVELPWLAIWSMAEYSIIKGFVGILYSRVQRLQVQALVQDCKTDVYFNTVSFIFPLIGSKFRIWYLGPLGAIIVSLFVVYAWANTAFSRILRLTGAAVSPRMRKKLMYLAWRFSPVIETYTSLTAYDVGDGTVVEVEITLNESSSLADAHNISQTMQYCFEGISSHRLPKLAEVDRSYVSVDYSPLRLRGHAVINFKRG